MTGYDAESGRVLISSQVSCSGPSGQGEGNVGIRGAEAVSALDHTNRKKSVTFEDNMGRLVDQNPSLLGKCDTI